MKPPTPPKHVSAFFRLPAGARRLLSGAAIWLCRLLPCLLPGVAWADDAIVRSEGRLQGYASSVTLQEPGSYFGSWLMLLVLGTLVMLVVFKNAKRTHLD
jgi:hypothetical protein